MNKRSIREFLVHPIRIVLSYVAPKCLANIYYRHVTPSGKGINWKSPKDLNEIINYLKFYSDTSQWTLFADKYRVREYVKSRVDEDILPTVYGVWTKAEDIDFDSLPNKFVLKTNHGSGTNLLVEDKRKLDRLKTVKIVNKWLSNKIGQETVEFHYLKIQPLVFAEEFLEDESVSSFSRSVIDYKFWVLDGKCQYVFVCADRDENDHSSHPYFDIYDMQWNQHSEYMRNCKTPIKIKKPQGFENMVKYAEALAYGHPQMRVDFYNINGKIYFGELTMTSQGGYMDYYTSNFLVKMGELTNINTYINKQKNG